MFSFLKKIDWGFIAPLLILFLMSLSILASFQAESSNIFWKRQILWFSISFLFIILFSFLDLSFLKKTKNTLIFYFLGIGLLLFVFFFGHTSHGAQSWIAIGSFSFQPADVMKIILIFTLSKYLAKRHVEIKSIRHIFITFLYFALPFFFIFIQPDFGSALILLGIWLGIIFASGVSNKHLLFLIVTGLFAITLMYFFVFTPNQQKRITTFFNPLSDIQNTGYNVYQSVVAVGSGGVFGKGIGHGTQSRLSFLPEHETDFIFSAISEEWGFFGSVLVLLLLFFILFRLIYYAGKVNDNFDTLFIVGVASYFATHIIINIGMNIGVMPVTGVPLPFLSYGGSHLVIESMALGLVMGIIRNNKKRSIPAYDLGEENLL